MYIYNLIDLPAGIPSEQNSIVQDTNYKLWMKI